MLRTLLLLLSALLLSAPVRAAESALDLLDAPVAYTADFTVSSPRGTYSGTVWHQPGLERRDVATSGGGQGVLIDRKADSVHLLGLSGKWAVALSLRAAAGMAGGLESWTVTRSKLREENVGGVRTTRWKVRADGPKGGFGGEMWTSREGIVVKVAGIMENASGDDSPVEMVLSNLRVGQTDAQALALGKGWFSFDLRSVPPERVVQAVEGLKPLLESRRGK